MDSKLRCVFEMPTENEKTVCTHTDLSLFLTMHVRLSPADVISETVMFLSCFLLFSK